MRLFDQALRTTPEAKNHLGKAVDDINPMRALELFQRISYEDCELLGVDPESGRPEQFIWMNIPVPPVCIRPSVAMDRGDLGRY